MSNLHCKSIYVSGIAHLSNLHCKLICVSGIAHLSNLYCRSIYVSGIAHLSNLHCKSIYVSGIVQSYYKGGLLLIVPNCWESMIRKAVDQSKSFYKLVNWYRLLLINQRCRIVTHIVHQLLSIGKTSCTVHSSQHKPYGICSEPVTHNCYNVDQRSSTLHMWDH